MYITLCGLQVGTHNASLLSQGSGEPSIAVTPSSLNASATLLQQIDLLYTELLPASVYFHSHSSPNLSVSWTKAQVISI